MYTGSKCLKYSLLEKYFKIIYNYLIKKKNLYNFLANLKTQYILLEHFSSYGTYTYCIYALVSISISIVKPIVDIFFIIFFNIFYLVNELVIILYENVYF